MAQRKADVCSKKSRKDNESCVFDIEIKEVILAMCNGYAPYFVDGDRASR